MGGLGVRCTFIALFLLLSGAACGDDSSGTPAETCTIDEACAERECGTEPECGFDCGACSDGLTCDDGQCVASCVADCEGRVCGPDGCGGTCGSCADDETCSDVGACEVAINEPPTIAFVGFANERLAEESFDIEWADDDPDSDAQIALYFDDDDEGADGTLIAEGISEDDEGDLYAWDVSTLSSGQYWLYAVIDDGTSSQTVYADSAVRVLTLECVEPVMGKFALDIETATFEIEVTIDGAPIDSTNTSADDFGSINIIRAGLDANFAGSFAFFDGQDPVPSVEVVLPVGVYNIVYQPRGAAMAKWPINGGFVAENVEVVDGGSYIIDLQTVGVTLDWTLNGETYSGTATEMAEIFLSGTDQSGAASVAIDTTQTAPQTVRMLPGSFNAYYVAPFGVQKSPSTVLPVNWGPLGEFDFSQDSTVTMDIPAVAQPIDATLNGNTWSTLLAGVTGSDISFLLERDAAQNCTTFCPPPDKIAVIDTSGPVLPATYTVFPGEFLIAFESFTSPHPQLPVSGVVGESVTLDGTATTLDLVSKAVTVDLSVNSTPVDQLSLGPATLSLVSYPQAFFGPEATISNQAMVFTAFEGPHDVRLTFDREMAGTTGGWPETGGAGRVIGTIDTSLGDTFSLDIQTAELTVEPRLAGSPISAANLGMDDLVRIFFRTANEQSSFFEIISLFDVLPQTSWTRPYLMGPIDIEYVGTFRNQSPWPSSFFETLQTIDLDADQTVVLDIEGTPVEFVVSIDGVPVESTGPVPPLSLGRVPFNESYEIHENGSVGDWAPLEARLFSGDQWITIDAEYLGNPAGTGARPAVACVRVPEP